jgi:hypothetical protein
MRECIRRCTAGAQEWRERYPGVVRRGNKLFPRGKTGRKGEVEGSAKEVQQAARLWWREEIRDAEIFLEARIRQRGANDQNQEADDEVAKMTGWKDRPVLKDVMRIIEEAEKWAGFEYER